MNGELAPIWKVTRLCCTSGQCVDCKQRGNLYGDRTRRKRIVHASKLTKPLADTMTTNWRAYEARTEAM
jgi:hypothetical protein